MKDASKAKTELELGIITEEEREIDRKLSVMDPQELPEELEMPPICSIDGLRLLLDEHEDEKAPKMDSKANFFNNMSLLTNLIFFTLLWSISFFDYYLLNFEIKYIPGNVHVNNLASGLSELISIYFPLFYLERFGIKLSLLMALLTMTVGGLFIVFLNSTGIMNALFVLIAKAGCSISMNICQLFPSIVFPSHLRARAYGFVELIARLVLIFCPLIVELEAPFPMLCFTITAGASIIFVFLIKTKRFQS